MMASLSLEHYRMRDLRRRKAIAKKKHSRMVVAAIRDTWMSWLDERKQIWQERMTAK
jgi:hypothetical protein